MKNVFRNHKIAAICGIVVLIAAVMAGAFYFLRSPKDDGLTSITLEEFQQYTDPSSSLAKKSSEDIYIYVGRDSCPDCEEVYPQLLRINSTHKLNMLYYNTTEDRESRPDEMYALLDELKVTSVPSILTVSAGQVTAQHDGKEFLELYP